MVELPKTEAELQALIDAKVSETTETLNAKHNSEMANLRKKHDDDIKKTKEQANLSAEQLAEQKAKEQQEQTQQELNELRQFKKISLLSERLKKEGLPEFFKNDNRLLTADDGNLDKVIKVIKAEYDANQPKGATHSTVVQTAQGNKQLDSKTDAYNKFGQALKEIVGS